MCFYPVCIILRPAAALGAAAARAHSGRTLHSHSLPCASSSAWADATAGLGCGGRAEAEFINSPRPPLRGGGAALPRTPPCRRSPPAPPAPPLPSPPPVPASLCPPGPPRGGRRGGRESAGASRLDLLLLRAGPVPGRRCHSGPGGARPQARWQDCTDHIAPTIASSPTPVIAPIIARLFFFFFLQNHIYK